MGLGVGGNLQLSNHWQLLAEMNTVIRPTSVNSTVGLRWLASKNIDVDAYLSNAAGLMDIGQLLPSGPWRVGGQVVISL